jgi:hypothetical protein
MMLEVDILRGTGVGLSGNRSNVPIMAHPPDTSSDLTFTDFIGTVIQENARKGVKLDFKDFSVVEECLQVLKNKSKHVSFNLS